MKRLVILSLLLILITVIPGISQYTGFDLEKTRPPELGPQPGPGDAMIAEKLEETNRLLREQNQLIAEQNRLLKQMLSQSRPLAQ